MKLKKEEFIKMFYETKNNKELADKLGVSKFYLDNLTKSMGLKRKSGPKVNSITFID